MKYEKPLFYSFSPKTQAACNSGSNATGNYGLCSSGNHYNGICTTAGTAPMGNCGNGIEAGSFGGECTSTGASARNGCNPNGNSNGSNKSVCSAGGNPGMSF